MRERLSLYLDPMVGAPRQSRKVGDLTTDEITPALCQRCGACCSQVVDGELVACRHLDVRSSTYRCTIYEIRPAVCRDYTCVRDGELSAAVADRVLDALKEAA